MGLFWYRRVRDHSADAIASITVRALDRARSADHYSTVFSGKFPADSAQPGNPGPGRREAGCDPDNRYRHQDHRTFPGLGSSPPVADDTRAGDSACSSACRRRPGRRGADRSFVRMPGFRRCPAVPLSTAGQLDANAPGGRPAVRCTPTPLPGTGNRLDGRVTGAARGVCRALMAAAPTSTAWCRASRRRPARRARDPPCRRRIRRRPSGPAAPDCVIRCVPRDSGCPTRCR